MNTFTKYKKTWEYENEKNLKLTLEFFYSFIFAFTKILNLSFFVFYKLSGFILKLSFGLLYWPKLYIKKSPTQKIELGEEYAELYQKTPGAVFFRW